MTEIEQLRADIETLKAAHKLFIPRDDAEAEKTDPFHEAKMSLDAWGMEDMRGYVRHLEAENKRLEAELARRPDYGPWVVIPANQDRIEILGRMHQYREYVFPRYADALNHRAKAYTPSDYKIVLLSDVFCTGEQR